MPVNQYVSVMRFVRLHMIDGGVFGMFGVIFMMLSCQRKLIYASTFE